MGELKDAVTRVVLRLGKLFLWAFVILGGFTYYGASVRMHRPATLTEWSEQMNRASKAWSYYYGQKPQYTTHESEYHKRLRDDLGLPPE